MIAKALGILMMLCYGVLKMPLQETSNQHNPVKKDKVAAQKHQHLKPMSNDTINKQNTVYVKTLKYTRDSNSRTFAQITFKNTTKQIITDISFCLDGDAAKGCNKAYEIKQKINLKPNHTISIPQLLAMHDCEVHEIKDIRVKYTMNINFTLD
ncbi:hypothetical protein OC25_24335 [Pedobacter kyungheensis]|uniref:Uncharacterized protein n=1 Tax=Pedobacter kyungheensis TaxID=1069985 RepID=A0A0C1FGH0_9SPHI|nr:hypothetical protein [Pedobacter kyungheensis]KIA90908.1 hypothetical protein OC25_24335 [Pedobacter kyungheensis]